MRRKQFCTIVGVDENYFKALRRREQLPFDSLDVDDRDHHHRFTLDEAWRLRCQLDLITNEGLPPEDSAKIVYNAFGYLDERYASLRCAADADLDIFLGRVHWRQGEADGIDHITGNLLEIARRCEAKALQNKIDGIGEERTRIVIVNISRAAREVLSRAEASA